MPRISTELKILQFMSEYDIPLQPRQIFGGMIVKRDITFSYGTLQNKLDSLVDSGDLERIKIDRDGNIDVMRPGDSGRSNYIIADDGRHRVADEYPE